MIPESRDISPQSGNTANYEILPTKTYQIDWVNKRIMGVTDGVDAVMQFIRKVLSTDKYAFEIYDWRYGNDLAKLIGGSYDYAVTRIPNIMKEALLVDDRILDIREFQFTRVSVDTLHVSCSVDTVYGVIKYDQEVMI